MTDRNSVQYRARAYREMETLWKLPDSLLGGTLRMRHEASEWIPAKESEDGAAYTSRVQMSYLYGGYQRVLEEMACKPFEKPVSVQTEAELGEFLDPLEENTDRQQTNLTGFAKEILHEALHRGLTHVLVDFPRMEADATLAQQRDAQARPYFIHVQPPRLLGWQTVREGDAEVLSMVRVYEETTEALEPYGEQRVERIRVYTRKGWEVHERIHQDEASPTHVANYGPGPDPNPGPESRDTEAGGGYKKVAEGTHSFGEVPLYTLYLNKTGYMQGRPVFENVAHLNLAHFQSTSRQRAYLDFARIGTVALLGFSEEDVANGVAWGINRFIRSSKGPQDAEVKTIEHSGAAIQAGREDLQDLEERMQIMGSAPLVQRATAITATGEARDEERGMSRAEAWIRDLERFLADCYEAAAKWLNTELPDDFAIDIFSDFGVTQRGAEEARLLFDMQAGGTITKETLLRELKRRGLFADAFDAGEELDRLEAEGPELPGMDLGALFPGAQQPAPPQSEDMTGQPDPRESADSQEE